jgi:hypothetical protein
VTQVSGTVTRVDRATEMARVDTGRGEIRVDLTNAFDSSGARVRARDLHAGDRVQLTGSFGNAADLFAATTVRFLDANDTTTTSTSTPLPPTLSTTLPMVTIWGTVSESLANGPLLVVREQKTNALFHINVADDLPIKTKSGSYATAERLKNGDAVVVKAYRDADGNYIGQTIRIR